MRSAGASGRVDPKVAVGAYLALAIQTRLVGVRVWHVAAAAAKVVAGEDTKLATPRSCSSMAHIAPWYAARPGCQLIRAVSDSDAAFLYWSGRVARHGQIATVAGPAALAHAAAGKHRGVARAASVLGPLSGVSKRRTDVAQMFGRLPPAVLAAAVSVKHGVRIVGADERCGR